jgi:DNA (cytosine-5)-methyltransferase 1
VADAGRPRLLELFSGEQGAAEGYRRAGFDVTCVDNQDHPAAPGPTIVADAFTYLAAHWHEYDAITGGPECRDHTDLAYRVGKRGTGWQLAAMLEAVRELPIPWVIENVESADMPCDLLLCGTEFDLSVVTKDGKRRWLRRHRKFAASFPLLGAGGCQHKGKPVVGVYGTGGGGQMTRGYKATREEACAVMGMPWAARAGVSQAIPPVYTEHIGKQLMAHLRNQLSEVVA